MNKKAKIGIIVLLSFVLLFSACSASSPKNSVQNEGAYGADTNDGDFDLGTNNDANREESEKSFENQIAQEKIIYTGRVNIETLEFEKTNDDILDYVKDLGGFIQSSNINGIGEKYDGSSQNARAEYVFRIPVKEFSGFMEEIQKYGNVISSEENSRNITTQYYDTQSRLNAYEIQEERLLELLKKAEEIEDLLEIEKELANVRYEIESLTTQMKTWDNLVEYTTITVSIREVKEITKDEPENFIEKIERTVVDSAKTFVLFLENLFIAIIYILPYIIVILILLIIILKIRSKKGKKINNKKDKKKNKEENKAEKEE